MLYLQTTFPEPLAWDIPNLLLEYGVANNVLLTYKCSKCSSFHCSVYQGMKKKCINCGQTAGLTTNHNALTQNELNLIYNLFDIYIQYSICEGFGIPQVEAAACGLPVVTLDHGAMAEIGKNINAMIVPIQRMFKEIETGSDRAYPNNIDCIEIITKLINMDNNDLRNIGNMSRQLCMNHYSWELTANKFMQIIDDVELNENLWNEKSHILENNELTLPNIDSNRDFIYYIVDSIICQPELKSTFFVEEIIHNLDNGISIVGNKINNFSREHAIKTLQNFLNNKYGMEKIRLNLIDMPQSVTEFLNY